MKSCLKCKYAEWHETKNGRLHPSGDGDCSYVPALPPCKVYFGITILGGKINRHKELKDHCAYYQERG